ncbi:MAG: hypothetical protein F6K00_19965 [Leptolyngbya sp. SIOISBB]|nr:hypothetical protein [Leptolyngbya sp. SIOISBB]
MEKITTYFQIAESIAVISGVIIAVWTYKSQVKQVNLQNEQVKSDARQARQNNSFAIIDKLFSRYIKESEVEILELFSGNTYEGIYGLKPGYFLVYKRKGENWKLSQLPISDVFIPFGSGFSFKDLSLVSPDEIVGSLYENLEISPIRKIAEHLNYISYECLEGSLDYGIIKYELGPLISTVSYLINRVGDNNPEECRELQERFKHLVRLNDALSRHPGPEISFAVMD